MAKHILPLDCELVEDSDQILCKCLYLQPKILMNKLMPVKLFKWKFSWDKLYYYIATTVTFFLPLSNVHYFITLYRGNFFRHLTSLFAPTSHSHTAFAQLKKQLGTRPLRIQCYFLKLLEEDEWESETFFNQLGLFPILVELKPNFIILLQALI